MSERLEFFYDYSCPYAYLASTQVRALALRTGAELVYEPFLLGGVFKSLGGEPMQSMSPPRARMNGVDMYRWAAHWQVPLVMPPGHPNRTVLALRATLASGDVPRASHALFSAYWAEGKNLADPSVVRSTLDAACFDGAALVARADAHKDELFARTAEASERGVFGAPAFFVKGELYWGQDRLDQVERALGFAPPRAPPRAPRPGAKLDFWYDFASPFACLAAMGVESLAARTGAELRYRPFLLGALFKAIGTANVPLFSFPEPKRRWFGQDLARAAAELGVPFRFPSRFPIRSVLPLRLALAAGPEVGRVTQALFRAAWCEDRDIEDASVLTAISREAGQGPGLVEAASSEAVKQDLRRNTDEAVALGLCGAPSFVVDGEVFWGQDRMAFVEDALTRA